MPSSGAAAATPTTTTTMRRHNLTYTVAPLDRLGPTLASHLLMVGACVCALFSDSNTESALLSTGLLLLGLAAISGYPSSHAEATTTTSCSQKLSRGLYFGVVFVMPVVLCRTVAALDYLEPVLGHIFQRYLITLAFVLPIMSLVLVAIWIQKQVWLYVSFLVSLQTTTTSRSSSKTIAILQCLAPTAFPVVLCGIFQIVFQLSPIGATGNPAMGLAVMASPVFKQAVVSVVGEIGLLAGMGWVASLGAGHLLGQTRRGHWILLATVWAACQLLGGWRLAAGMGLWDTPIQSWPLSRAPDLHVSCLCAGGSHHASTINETQEMLDRINARLAAGDDLILLSEAALRHRIAPNEIQWPADNPGAVVALAFAEPVSNTVPNTTSSKLYNSVELLQAGQSIFRYNKNRPVPVMETPWVQAGNEPPHPTDVVFTPLMQMPTNNNNSSSSSSWSWQRTNVTIRVAAAICFDFDFPDALRHARQADLVIGPSNYWSSLGRNLWSDNMYRAIESGFTLFKCARNGISGAVDPLGRTLAAKPTLAGDTYTAQIPVQPGVSTIYAHHGGYWFGWLCVGLSVVWMMMIVVFHCRVTTGDGNTTTNDGTTLVIADEAAVRLPGDEGGLEAPLLSPEERNGDHLDAEAPLESIQEQQQQEEADGVASSADQQQPPNNNVAE